MTAGLPETSHLRTPRNNAAARAKGPVGDEVVAEIARETGLPVADVAARYAEELSRLRHDATVDLYLELLAAKRVRSALRGRPLADQAPATRQ